MLSRYVLLLGIAVAVITVDQTVKALVTNNLAGRPPVSLFHGLIWLDYTQNSGAAFGIFRAGGLVFEAVAVLVGAGILLYYPRLSEHGVLVRMGLGLILGGALGNLADRIRLGYVVDFIDLRWWPVFNLADSAIVLGVALLVLRGLIGQARAGAE